MTRLEQMGLWAMLACGLLATAPAPCHAEALPPAVAQDAHDGAHDFDFLIGAWKAHLKKRLNPLTGSTTWVEYDGTSVTHKLLDSAANFEEFQVANPAQKLSIHAQTLRLYNPQSHQWSIFGLDIHQGTLGLPATVGHFTDGRGELFDQEEWKGQWIQVRYQWTHPDATTAHMEQSFSTDGGKTWEVNWICELTRAGA
jgi:hypothetical protein